MGLRCDAATWGAWPLELSGTCVFRVYSRVLLLRTASPGRNREPVVNGSDSTIVTFFGALNDGFHPSAFEIYDESARLFVAKVYSRYLVPTRAKGPKQHYALRCVY